MTPDTFGNLDGEAIDLANVKLTGSAAFGRVVDEGEHLVLVVEAVAGPVTVRRVDGRLVRSHALKLIGAAEPTERLADEAAEFLEAFVDEIEGRTRLPFDPDDEAAADDPDDEGEAE